MARHYSNHLTVASRSGHYADHPAPDRADLRPENIQDAVIRLAGNSQDGIQTAGAFLARLAGRSDHDVMTYMTIPSTISGGPSIFQVRIGSGRSVIGRRRSRFSGRVLSTQLSGPPRFSAAKAACCFTIPTTSSRTSTTNVSFMSACPSPDLTVEALGGTAKDKGKNIFVLGLIAKIFNLDADKLKKLITEKFAGKDESIVNTALMAFQAGYAYPVGNVLTTPLSI